MLREHRALGLAVWNITGNATDLAKPVDYPDDQPEAPITFGVCR
jgi:hypothetical protein